MIPVTKEQSAHIKTHSPTTYITTTSKDKSKGKRKKRYAPETPLVFRLIKEYEIEKENKLNNKGGI